MHHSFNTLFYTLFGRNVLFLLRSFVEMWTLYCLTLIQFAFPIIIANESVKIKTNYEKIVNIYVRSSSE